MVQHTTENQKSESFNYLSGSGNRALQFSSENIAIRHLTYIWHVPYSNIGCTIDHPTEVSRSFH
jgi:hypothetical protein